MCASAIGPPRSRQRGHSRPGSTTSSRLAARVVARRRPPVGRGRRRGRRRSPRPAALVVGARRRPGLVVARGRAGAGRPEAVPSLTRPRRGRCSSRGRCVRRPARSTGRGAKRRPVPSPQRMVFEKRRPSTRCAAAAGSVGHLALLSLRRPPEVPPARARPEPPARPASLLDAQKPSSARSGAPCARARASHARAGGHLGEHGRLRHHPSRPPSRRRTRQRSRPRRRGRPPGQDLATGSEGSSSQPTSDYLRQRAPERPAPPQGVLVRRGLPAGAQAKPGAGDPRGQRARQMYWPRSVTLMTPRASSRLNVCAQHLVVGRAPGSVGRSARTRARSREVVEELVRVGRIEGVGTAGARSHVSSVPHLVGVLEVVDVRRRPAGTSPAARGRR